MKKSKTKWTWNYIVLGSIYHKAKIKYTLLLLQG